MPAWSAAGYLAGAKTFQGFYSFFASPGVIEVTNWLNSWGMLLAGTALLFGVAIRWGAIAGLLFMTLFYFPGLDFPKAGEHGYLVDEHVIYGISFAFLALSTNDHLFALGKWLGGLAFIRRSSFLRSFLSR
jgi:thiosulfate dehydrogenase [quinone] large subunit